LTENEPRIFLCHASDDKARVRELYHQLKGAGYHPWLDEEDLLPGQAWWAEIKKVISDPYNLVVVCLSHNSVTKRGVVQREIKRALDVLEEMPEDTIYMIPARLEDCRVPERLSDLHWVDLFEPSGFEKLKRSLNSEISKRQPGRQRFGTETELQSILSHLSMQEIRDHYLYREETHKSLLNALTTGKTEEYVKLALGIADPAGNYSSAEHHLGWRIIGENTYESVFELAKSLYACSSPRKIPGIIRSHNLNYLKISVGSEMALMLHPDIFWVANVRTVWANLLIKYGDNYELANAELELYRDSDRTSEMDYQIWAEIYAQLEVSLERLHNLGADEAGRQGVKPGKLKFLWADAVASVLYHYSHK